MKIFPNNGVPIAEFDGKLIVCPMMDTSKSYKPVLVYMDREGNVIQKDHTVNMKI